VQASELFRIAEGVPTLVKINGYHHLISMLPRDGPFPDVNFLGCDFYGKVGVTVLEVPWQGKVRLYLGPDHKPVF